MMVEINKHEENLMLLEMVVADGGGRWRHDGVGLVARLK
jgi:hypothetical protein